MPKAPPQPLVPTASTSERAADQAREAMAASEAAAKEAKVAATEAEKSKEKAEELAAVLAYGLKVKLDKEKDAHRAEETAFTALQAKTKASEQRASDEGTATQGLRVKLEGMEADRDKCKAEMEKLTAELEKVAAEKDAALAHQKELQDALDAANKQLKKEGIVIASKDEFIKTLIQTPAAA